MEVAGVFSGLGDSNSGLGTLLICGASVGRALLMTKDQSPALIFALILLGSILWFGPWWSGRPGVKEVGEGARVSEAGLAPTAFKDR